MQDREQDQNFVRFTDREDIFEALCKTESYDPDFEPLYALTAERLAHKAYDSSAFVFILIELIYEFEVAAQTFSRLLSEFVLSLTDDIYLAASALDAYQEVRATLEVEEPEIDTAEEPSPPTSISPAGNDAEESAVDDDEVVTRVIPTRKGDASAKAESRPSSEATTAPGEDSDPESLMVDLQLAQKRITDLGLSTRMALEMTLVRPDRTSVRQTLTKVHSLRTALRHFEELLGQSEDRILESIGVLERPRS